MEAESQTEQQNNVDQSNNQYVQQNNVIIQENDQIDHISDSNKVVVKKYNAIKNQSLGNLKNTQLQPSFRSQKYIRSPPKILSEEEKLQLAKSSNQNLKNKLKELLSTIQQIQNKDQQQNQDEKLDQDEKNSKALIRQQKEIQQNSQRIQNLKRLISGTYNEKEANDRENEIITYNKKIDILKAKIYDIKQQQQNQNMAVSFISVGEENKNRFASVRYEISQTKKDNFKNYELLQSKLKQERSLQNEFISLNQQIRNIKNHSNEKKKEIQQIDQIDEIDFEALENQVKSQLNIIKQLEQEKKDIQNNIQTYENLLKDKNKQKKLVSFQIKEIVKSIKLNIRNEYVYSLSNNDPYTELQSQNLYLDNQSAL